MKNLIIVSFLIILLVSCNSMGKGKIIKRVECLSINSPSLKDNNKDQYLVNTSTSQEITFTLKETTTHFGFIHDQLKTKPRIYVNTRVYKLKPGEEYSLGCGMKIMEDTGNYCCDTIVSEYEIVGALIEK